MTPIKIKYRCGTQERVLETNLARLGINRADLADPTGREITEKVTAHVLADLAQHVLPSELIDNLAGTLKDIRRAGEAAIQKLQGAARAQKGR